MTGVVVGVGEARIAVKKAAWGMRQVTLPFTNVM